MKRPVVGFVLPLALGLFVLTACATSGTGGAAPPRAPGGPPSAASGGKATAVAAAPATSVAQVTPPPASPPEQVERPEATSGACPADMVEIDGDYYPVVEHICATWIEGQQNRDRCAEYRAAPYRTFGRPEHKRYCIDRYEWPNKKGVKPATAQTWEDARDACRNAGKRLCKEKEWTLACEGPERLPYPYGRTRDSSACNIDKPYIQPDPVAYSDMQTRASEVARLDQREPSGSRERCVSGYGVHDMTGNVDEWVINPEGHVDKKPYMSGLKGGYWGPVRNRCRPMTTDHNQWDSYYQMGFRCCADVPAGAPAKSR